MVPCSPFKARTALRISRSLSSDAGSLPPAASSSSFDAEPMVPGTSSPSSAAGSLPRAASSSSFDAGAMMRGASSLSFAAGSLLRAPASLRFDAGPMMRGASSLSFDSASLLSAVSFCPACGHAGAADSRLASSIRVSTRRRHPRSARELLAGLCDQYWSWLTSITCRPQRAQTPIITVQTSI